MANYAISGVWKDANGTITDYAFHLITEGTIPDRLTVGPAEKYSKAQAIELLGSHLAQTAIWNYTEQLWELGAFVQVAGFFPNRYLRTIADLTVRDNLDNLINYGWITNNFI